MGVHIRHNLRGGCTIEPIPERTLYGRVFVHGLYQKGGGRAAMVRLYERNHVRFGMRIDRICKAAFRHGCARRRGFGCGGMVYRQRKAAL